MENEKQTGGEGKDVKNKKMFVIGLISFLVLALLVFVGVIVYRVYNSTSTDGFTVASASILNLPAAKVDGETISYSQYAEDMEAIKTMRSFDEANAGPSAGMTDEQMSDNVLWRLVNNVLVARAAQTFGVTVEEEDLSSIREELMSQFENEEQLNEELEKRYGWDLATYEEKVIKPYILQQKIDEEMSLNPTYREETRTKAQTVLDQLKNGGDFTALAAEFGEDGTATVGGDLGWFGKGVMVPQFESAVFALNPGELSQELVESPFGYHIVKVDEKREVAGEDGEMTEEVKARHILFRFVSISTYLDDLSKKVQIKVYLNVHDPFEPIEEEGLSDDAENEPEENLEVSEDVIDEEDGE